MQSTQYVTCEVLELWRGTKSGGNDPAGIYTRVDGLDPLSALTIEAV